MGISIVIPSTGDRTVVLRETLVAALNAVENIDAEIIVIKNKEKQVDLFHPKLRLIDVDFNNVSKSRNFGAALAVYDLLLFIDDDILISVNTLSKFIAFEKLSADAYVISATWVHSAQVHELRQNTFLGQMLAMHFPNDSYETRYKNVGGHIDWQDNTYFKSSMQSVFWEMCFSMRKKDYLRIGGMNESYSFGYEGVDFLKRLLAADMHYYIDPTNTVLHNEWDKFNDWKIPEKRWQVEAQLINDGKGTIVPTYKNYFYKLVYGVLIYTFAPLLKYFLHASTVKKRMLKTYFKVFDVYSMAIYWHRISWQTITRLQDAGS